MTRHAKIPDNDLLQKLCNSSIKSCEPSRLGGNNKIFRVESTRGTFALKIYPSSSRDYRARLDREFSAYEFLSENGINSIESNES